MECTYVVGNCIKLAWINFPSLAVWNFIWEFQLGFRRRQTSPSESWIDPLLFGIRSSLKILDQSQFETVIASPLIQREFWNLKINNCVWLDDSRPHLSRLLFLILYVRAYALQYVYILYLASIATQWILVILSIYYRHNTSFFLRQLAPSAPISHTSGNGFFLSLSPFQEMPTNS